MKYSYCTLFDSKYLPKGMVLCDSFLRNNIESKMYILALDDICFRALRTLDYNRVVVIGMDHFMNDELSAIRRERTHAEFCWACTASLIKYIFLHYKEEVCTYVDSDLCFYKNPNELVDHMVENQKSVQIIPHGFSKTFTNRLQEKSSGKFCVEFNSFMNNKEGNEVLDTWVKETLASTAYGTKGYCGDQMYLNDWPLQYSCVNILDVEGAGVAPWNMDRYQLVGRKNNDTLIMVDKKKIVPLFFYHFHGITDIDSHTFDIHVYRRFWKVDKTFVDKLYISYLKNIIESKKWAKEHYNIDSTIGIHPAIKELERDKKNNDNGGLEETIDKVILMIRSVINRRKDILSISD